MDHIEYFKLQAKNLLKDFKTRFFNEKEEVYDYHPKNFDINGIFCDFDIPDYKDDFTFTLMNAQHLIAQLAGFSNWGNLVNASSAKLELRHLLFDNAYKINLEEWEIYIAEAESMKQKRFTDEDKLEFFKQVFLSGDKHRSDFIPYRFDLAEKREIPPTDYQAEDIDIADIYYELHGQEKDETIKAGNSRGYLSEDIVECLHCGERYLFKDVKVLRMKPGYREFDFDPIVCKNFPKCDGTLIDLFPVQEPDKQTEENE